MSDRIALFAQGELAQVGSPRELYQQPRTEFVADFIGEANILRGTCSKACGQVVGPHWHADLSAAHATPFQDGECVILALRPENVRLQPDNANAAPRPNEIKGIIRDAIYLGAEFRYTVVLPSGDVIHVRSRDFKMAEMLTPGAEVVASWNTGDAIPLKG
jgi:putative spermidine/putrescine transport system ATP-binding protein